MEPIRLRSLLEGKEGLFYDGKITGIVTWRPDMFFIGSL
jgi:hypothetical protein